MKLNEKIARGQRYVYAQQYLNTLQGYALTAHEYQLIEEAKSLLKKAKRCGQIPKKPKS